MIVAVRRVAGRTPQSRSLEWTNNEELPNTLTPIKPPLPADRATLDPTCGAAMRAGTANDPELGEQMPVWRCIRCGAEMPR